MPELATAWITLAVSADNMQRDIRRELNKVDDGTARTVGRKIGRDLESGVGDGARGAASQVQGTLSERLGTQVGSVVGRGIGAGIKVGVAGAAGAAALAVGGIGVALTKGFDRLKSIDQAKFKLQALGNDSETTAKIMDNALASVKGTAFGLQDAATAAASAVAAGIKPGEDLTKYLKEVGDAAAVAGTNFDDMGSIFNKIQTSNKAYTDDLQQLSDRGLPIFKWLQDEYGVTGDKLTEMVQKGEVDAAHFQAAIDANIGGAAQKMGQSFDGAVDNMEASVARLGANFITAILGGDPANALEGPTEAVARLTTKFDEVGVWVNAHRGEIHGFFQDVKDVATQVGGAIKNITTFLVENKGAAETLATVFIGWKVATAVFGVVESLKSMGFILRNQLPADAEAGASGISKALALIVVPEIGKQLNDQIQGWLKENAPGLFDLNNTNTPDQLGKKARDWWDNLGKDSTGTPKGPLPGGSATPSPFDPNPLPIPLPRRAAGGAVFGAGTGTSDSIPAMLSNGEFVVNAAAARKNMPLLEIINSSGLPGFSEGGAVGSSGAMDAWSLAQNASGRKYGYGGVGGAGNAGLYDCSGFMSDIYAALTGKPLDGNERYFTTESDFSKLGFAEGYDPNSPFNIGVHNGGGGKNSHMAGTLFGVNVESGGSAGITQLGGTAAGATDLQFEKQYHLTGVNAGSALAQSLSRSMGEGAATEADRLASSSSDGQGAGNGFDASSIGQSLFGGILQSIGLDGSVFSNPFEWPNVKSGIALANFGGGLLQSAIGGGSEASGGGPSIAGLNFPSMSGLISPNTPTSPIDPNTVAHGQAGGVAPGPTFNVTANGMDPKAVTQKQSALYNGYYRGSGLPAVRP